MEVNGDNPIQTEVGKTEIVKSTRNEICNEDGTLLTSKKSAENEHIQFCVLENGMKPSENENEIYLKNSTDYLRNNENDFFEIFMESDKNEIDIHEINEKNIKIRTTQTNKNENCGSLRTKKIRNKMRNTDSPCIAEGSSIFSTEGHLFLIEPSLRIKKQFDPEKKIGKYPICSFD